jgi:hypothetical protein
LLVWSGINSVAAMLTTAVAVKGGAQDCPYTYMCDLVAGRYRPPLEDEGARRRRHALRLCHPEPDVCGVVSAAIRVVMAGLVPAIPIRKCKAVPRFSGCPARGRA